ncbi:MAG: NosD domain-containing protein [Candidatus Diapherotrites archaeon]
MANSNIPHAAIAAAVLLLLIGPVAAGSLGDVFGAFANLGKVKPQFDFDNSGGPITVNDVLTALANVVGFHVSFPGAGRCSADSDCGSGATGAPYCDGNSVVQDANAPACLNPGTAQSACSANVTTSVIEECAYGCYDGNCQLEPQYCCAGTGGCTISVCSLNGQTGNISCIMQAGQTMQLTNLNDCRLTLLVENDGAMGRLYINNSSGNTVAAGDINTSSYGLYLYGASSNNTIHTGSITTTTSSGLRLENASGNTVAAGSITTTSGYGLYLIGASRNTVAAGSITTTSGYGLSLASASSNNTIHAGDIAPAIIGVYLNTGSNDNAITSGNITATNHGVYLTGASSGNNIATGDVTANLYNGLYLNTGSNGNTIHAGDISSASTTVTLTTASGNNISTGGITTNTGYGLYVGNTSIDNIITTGDIASNTNNGLYLTSYSSNNAVSTGGITVSASNGAVISNAANNTAATGSINSAKYGLYLYNASGNAVTTGGINSVQYGVLLNADADVNNSSNNTVTTGDIHVTPSSSSYHAVLLQRAANNYVQVGSITVDSLTSGIYLYTPNSGNTVKAGSVTLIASDAGRGVYVGSNTYTPNALVCAGTITGGLAKCYKGTVSVMVCENGTPVAGCDNSAERTCGEC